MKKLPKIPKAEAPPDKLWAWLEAALEDIEIVRKTAGYSVDMTEWVVRNPDTCTSCLAGAAMLRRTGIASNVAAIVTRPMQWYPSDAEVSAAQHHRLRELNYLREGGLDLLEGTPRPEHVAKALRWVREHRSIDSRDSEEVWTAWHAQMRIALEWLKEIDY
jgi:hypothetical protein